MSLSFGIAWHTPIIDAKRRSIGLRWQTLGDQALWDVALPGPEAGLMLVHAPEESLRRWVRRPDVPDHVVLEIPASCLQDPWWNDWAKDTSLLPVQVALNGLPAGPLPEHWLARLNFVLVPWTSDRRRHAMVQGGPPPGYQRRVVSFSTEITNWNDAEMSFATGVGGIIGWPWGVGAAIVNMNASEQTLMRLLQQIEDDVDTSVLQRTMKQDATIALKLMQYLASPMIGQGVEVRSIGQALNILGRARLKRWLVVLLVNASKDVNQNPHRHRAMRRGWLMEKLGRRLAPTTADEMFMVGAFSMVDRLWGWSEQDLRQNTALSSDVIDAIFHLKGAYGLALRMLESMEAGTTAGLPNDDWGQMANDLGLSVAEVHTDFCATVSELAMLTATT